MDDSWLLNRRSLAQDARSAGCFHQERRCLKAKIGYDRMSMLNLACFDNDPRVQISCYFLSAGYLQKTSSLGASRHSSSSPLNMSGQVVKTARNISSMGSVHGFATDINWGKYLSDFLTPSLTEYITRAFDLDFHLCLFYARNAPTLQSSATPAICRRPRVFSAGTNGGKDSLVHARCRN